uniref:Uncharacterized protein n=1 Tax=Oryza meridionalis TaxID=40149 RepID=A0A0E0ED27_9ORYZ
MLVIRQWITPTPCDLLRVMPLGRMSTDASSPPTPLNGGEMNEGARSGASIDNRHGAADTVLLVNVVHRYVVHATYHYGSAGTCRY